MTESIYLDYAATTPLDERVVEAMKPFLAGKFGNPSSLYSAGREASRSLDEARESFASLIGASSPSEIIFTGCGTESDNMAVLGIARAVRAKTGRTHLVVSAFEHKAVLAPAQLLGKQGFELTLLKPRTDGLLYPEDLAAVVTDNTALVSLMHVNNELGTVQPVQELAGVAHSAGSLFHSDTIQSLGKIDFHASSFGVDAASFSAHKIYGPRGVGALYLRKGTPMEPLLLGGGQESRRRSGTENLAGIVGMTEALKIMDVERASEARRLSALRNRIIDGLLGGIDNTLLNGDRESLVPHIASFVVKGVEGESMLLQLDHKGLMVATGSACSSGSLEPSHVLTAIGCPPELAHGSLRISVGRFTTDEDVSYFLAEFGPIVDRLRAMSPAYERMIARD